jgi:hypothetical protein
MLMQLLLVVAYQNSLYGGCVLSAWRPAAVAFTPAAIKQYNITDDALFSPYCHALPNSTFAQGLESIQCIDIGDLKAGG